MKLQVNRRVKLLVKCWYNHSNNLFPKAMKIWILSENINIVYNPNLLEHRYTGELRVHYIDKTKEIRIFSPKIWWKLTGSRLRLKILHTLLNYIRDVSRYILLIKIFDLYNPFSMIFSNPLSSLDLLARVENRTSLSRGPIPNNSSGSSSCNNSPAPNHVLA